MHIPNPYAVQPLFFFFSRSDEKCLAPNSRVQDYSIPEVKERSISLQLHFVFYLAGLYKLKLRKSWL